MASIVSGYSDVDATGSPEDYVRRLDETGAHAFWQAVKAWIVESLDLGPGDCVLDVGCGAGDDVRALAGIVGPAGLAAGVDSSAVMIAEARRRAEASGVPAAFHLGDAHGLPFAEARFDACRAERVLQHVEDPRQVLAEMVRVARQGAQIVAVEPDYGAAAIAGADPALSREIVKSRCGHFRNGTIGRRLPRLFAELQLGHISVTMLAATTTDIDRSDERRILGKHVEAARNAGIVTEAEGTAWLQDLEAAGREGRYRRALPVFLVSGRKLPTC